MGNRALIVTEEDFNVGSGMAMYLHWNGGRDSVEAFLQYCKMRGFRSPDNDCYGWARLVQVIANFFGGDGLSIGIEHLANIHNDVGDNGTYIIKGWDIVGREFYSGEEQNEYDRLEFLMELDEAQPERQQLGFDMIDCLLHHGTTLSDVASMYNYTISRRKNEGIEPKKFEIGKRYGTEWKSPIEVLERGPYFLRVRYKDSEISIPKYVWRDGTESAVIDSERGSVIESTEVME